MTNDRSRPEAAPESLAGDYLDSTRQRRAFARSFIDKARGPMVDYGSPEWCQLNPADPMRLAAVFVAAESWASQADTLVEDLRAEVASLSRAHKRLEDAEYVARAASHREQWSGVPVGRSFTERRRQQLEDAKPRPGDFKGVGR